MTWTSAKKLDVMYHWTAKAEDGRVPEEVLELDDRRIVAQYPSDPSGHRSAHVFENRSAFAAVHPCQYPQRQDGARLPIEAPPMPATFAVSVDWAEVDHLMAELDRARRGTRIGNDCLTDAFGGSYSPVLHRRSLAGLVRLVASVDRCARDAWDIVHQAKAKDTDVDTVRIACRVAVACSRAFAMLERAGLIDNASQRICGTCPGYGLTGLRWLVGAREDRGVTTEQVDRFVSGAPADVFLTGGGLS